MSKNQPRESTQKLIRLPELKNRVPLSRSAIYLLVSKGQFPKPISMSTRSVAWIESEIDAWVAARISAARSEKEAA